MSTLAKTLPVMLAVVPPAVLQRAQLVRPFGRAVAAQQNVPISGIGGVGVHINAGPHIVSKPRLRLAAYVFGSLIVPQPHKPAMPKVTVRSPFYELKHAHQRRL